MGVGLRPCSLVTCVSGDEACSFESSCRADLQLHLMEVHSTHSNAALKLASGKTSDTEMTTRKLYRGVADRTAKVNEGLYVQDCRYSGSLPLIIQ